MYFVKCGGVWVQEKSIFQMKGGQISLNKADLAGGGMYIKGVFEATGGTVTNNYSDSDYHDMAIEATGEVREGTSLPTEFIDVAADAYYYKPVVWALEKKITNGTSEITFSPDGKCNTAQILTFLWRAAGKPECKTRLRFTDTKDLKYEKYYEAIAWAVEQGITNGTSETTFSPGESCTRGQIVTFLWRAAQNGLI